MRKFRGNSQEYFLGICGNSQESFTGTSSENVDSNSEEFLITHSQEFLETHSQEFLVTHSWKFHVTWRISHNQIWRIYCNQFQWIYCYHFCRTIGENVDKSCGNSWEFPEKSSSEPIPGNFLGTIPKIFARVPLEYLDIFSAYSSKFTDQDLDPIAVNNLKSIYFAPPTSSKSECYSHFWSYWSCYVFCLLYNWIVKKHF